MGALGEADCANATEDLASGAQDLASIYAAALPAEPLSIQEPGAGEAKDLSATGESPERLPVSGLGLPALADERTR